MIIGRGRPREHTKGTPDHVTSRGSPTDDDWSDIVHLPDAHARTLPRESLRGDAWWRHFWCKGPTRADIVQRPVAHAQTLSMEPPSGSRDLRSLSVAMWYLYYCTTCTTTIVRKNRGKPEKKYGETSEHAQNILPVTWLTSLPVAPPPSTIISNTTLSVLIYYLHVYHKGNIQYKPRV